MILPARVRTALRVALVIVTVAVATSAIVAWGTFPVWTSPQKDWLRFVFVGIAFCLVSGALGLVGEALGVTRRGEAVLEGARAAWPSALLLCAMPYAERQPDLVGQWGPAGVALGAALVLAYRVHLRSPTRVPVAAALARRRPGAWELALLGVSLLVGVLYLRLGALSEGNFQNDSAYYFGVARHIALSRRIEEPIVWHMVNLPATLRHAPFDYWGGLTPLVLAPVLAVFGATQHVAFLGMAAVSGLSVILFWYLICVALPLRYRALSALTLLAFAFSPSADTYRFDTESLPVHHCVLILAMIGIATDRLLLAVVAGFLLLVNRTDGMVLFVAFTFVAALRARARPGGVRRVAAAAGGLFTAYVLRNLISFHAPLPPGASAGTAVKDQWDLFALHLPRKPLSKLLLERAESAYLLQRIDLLIDYLRGRAILPAQPLWFMLAALPGITYFRRRSGGLARAVPGVAFGAGLLILWASGPLAHEWRTLGAILPLLVLACGQGASASLDLLVTGTRRARPMGVAWPLLATAAAFVVAYPIAIRLQPYTGRVRASLYPKEMELEKLDPLLQGAPVAAVSPWYVMAHTHSPVVSVPEDGEASMVEILHKYRAEWIVVPTPGYAAMRGSGTVIAEMASGNRTSLGDLKVERVKVEGSLLVFRVLWP